MSIGPSHLAGSISGGQLPQARGAELDRNRDEAVQQAAQAEATKAAGADGALHENAESSDRDADGHSYGPPIPHTPAETDDASDDLPQEDPHSIDPSGACGQNLDLSG